MTLSSVDEAGERMEEEQGTSFFSVQPRILIVDGDHPSVLAVYGMAKSFNTRVDAANGGAAALDCMKKNRYDAVITDLEMDDVSGYELAGWIRGNSPDTRIIMMTESDPAGIERYRETGIVDHWIFKPFGISEFSAALHDSIPGEVVNAPG